MKATVRVAELRQNLSRYLRRVEQGERLLVTDHNRPVAELGPPPSRQRGPPTHNPERATLTSVIGRLPQRPCWAHRRSE